MALGAPFALLADGVFASPLAVDALYRSGGQGPGMVVRVVPSLPVGRDEFSGLKLRAETPSFRIRASDVALPAIGDTIDVGIERWRVTQPPEINRRRTVWSMDTIKLRDLPTGNGASFDDPANSGLLLPVGF